MKYQGYRLEFSEEKNLLLKETRGVGLEDVVTAVEEKQILGDIQHNSKKYPHQRILVIKIKDYIYAVPYVIDKKRKVIFLKTAYPSRVLTDKYLKGGAKNESDT
ncbi:toxin [Candidatus Daviesbacteria bacterium]|nr:toxin [Candidatus Daviesbacteria bacterium]